MLFGAIKSKSTPGYIGVALLALIPVIIAFGKINPDQYILSQNTQDNFISSGFQSLNFSLAKLLSNEG
jgi:hypothetical protein